MPHNHSPADGTSRLCLNEAILGHRVKSRWRGNGERACLGGSREPYWCVGWGLAKVRCPSRLGGRGASLDPPTSHNGFIPLPNPPSPAAWDNILLFFAKDLSTVHKGPDDQFLRLTNSRFSLSFTTFRVNSQKALDIAQDVVFCSEINAHSRKDSKSLQLITVLIITGLNGRPTVP